MPCFYLLKYSIPDFSVRSATIKSPKLLYQVLDKLHMKRESIQAEQAYMNRIKRFTSFHSKRHPKDMAARLLKAPWILFNAE